jgi:hypothetical protein
MFSVIAVLITLFMLAVAVHLVWNYLVGVAASIAALPWGQIWRFTGFAGFVFATAAGFGTLSWMGSQRKQSWWEATLFWMALWCVIIAVMTIWQWAGEMR